LKGMPMSKPVLKFQTSNSKGGGWQDFGVGGVKLVGGGGGAGEVQLVSLSKRAETALMAFRPQ